MGGHSQFCLRWAPLLLWPFLLSCGIGLTPVSGRTREPLCTTVLPLIHNNGKDILYLWHLGGFSLVFKVTLYSFVVKFSQQLRGPPPSLLQRQGFLSRHNVPEALLILAGESSLILAGPSMSLSPETPSLGSRLLSNCGEDSAFLLSSATGDLGFL